MKRQPQPGSQLAKACKYTLSLWDKLTRFLEYPELELSNPSTKAKVGPCGRTHQASSRGVD